MSTPTSDEILDAHGFFFDMDGQPMTLREWGELFADLRARTLGLDEFDMDGIAAKVMTVWLGMDEDYYGGPQESPRIFGTVVWVEDALVSEYRTTTKADALKMHQHVTAARRNRA